MYQVPFYCTSYQQAFISIDLNYANKTFLFEHELMVNLP